MNYIPTKFSLNGHQTFPLRYGWLEKICINLIDDFQLNPFDISKIRHEEFVSDYGLGMNMAKSLRFWLKACDIVKENIPKRTAQFTPFAVSVFGKNGSDPYLENLETIWILHWKLIQNYQQNLTWYWYFNHFANSTFDRLHLVDEILSAIGKIRNDDTSQQSIKRDVDCFVRSYLTSNTNSTQNSEDLLESPFAELNLFSVGLGGLIHAPRKYRGDVSLGLLALSIGKVWSNLGGNINTLNLETLLDSPFSPGRCFLMNRESLLDRLELLENMTNGALVLDSSAGLHQIMINDPQTFKWNIEENSSKLMVQGIFNEL